MESDDEFFGDQCSESDSISCVGQVNSIKGDKGDAPSDPFGNIADHEYRSREASIKTLSYLDGYDETKEEKLQNGFSDGYRQSFSDAFRIGRALGSTCAKAALDESLTLGLQSGNRDRSDKSIRTTKKSNTIESPATLIRQFLTNEILIGSKDKPDDTYGKALLKLGDQLDGAKN